MLHVTCACACCTAQSRVVLTSVLFPAFTWQVESSPEPTAWRFKGCTLVLRRLATFDVLPRRPGSHRYSPTVAREIGPPRNRDPPRRSRAGAGEGRQWSKAIVVSEITSQVTGCNLPSAKTYWAWLLCRTSPPSPRGQHNREVRHGMRCVNDEVTTAHHAT